VYIVDCVIDHSSSRSSISAIIANEHRPLGYHHRRAGWLSPSSHDTNICVRRSRIGVRDWVSSGEEAAETFNDRYLSAALDYVAAVNFASTPTRTGRQLSLPGVVRRQPHCVFTCRLRALPTAETVARTTKSVNARCRYRTVTSTSFYCCWFNDRIKSSDLYVHVVVYAKLHEISKQVSNKRTSYIYVK